MTITDVPTLHDAVLALLRAQDNLDVFDGSVDDAGQPPVRVDPDGRAHMYAVLYVSPGRPDPGEETVCGDPGQLLWSFQVTAAGGDTNRAMQAAAKVRAALTGVRLGPATGRIREPFDPGPAREDRDPSPSRWYVPLPFTLEA
ncbi:hypothetical protein [Segeticoccus rhizosphaerae]|uniref:hypothetical protein n=1 Tax=Segeticoccus rhizosphaerae TaxID=1104777 RepID=UPI0012658E47|nr:hypothetical protein [Segeticoccus rhizosphaerae]